MSAPNVFKRGHSQAGMLGCRWGSRSGLVRGTGVTGWLGRAAGMRWDSFAIFLLEV